MIDDLHWAEPLLLDLVEHLVQWGTGVPLLVLVGAPGPSCATRARRSRRPAALVADVVTLGGLDAGAATRLAANVIGAAELPAAVAGRVLATSEGNPLFVGELVRMLVHEGALKREGDRWIDGRRARRARDAADHPRAARRAHRAPAARGAQRARARRGRRPPVLARRRRAPAAARRCATTSTRGSSRCGAAS